MPVSLSRPGERKASFAVNHITRMLTTRGTGAGALAWEGRYVASSPMASDVSILAALVAGIISFLSPCVLPLVPPYLVYLTGATRRAGRHRRTARGLAPRGDGRGGNVRSGLLHRVRGARRQRQHRRRAGARLVGGAVDRRRHRHHHHGAAFPRADAHRSADARGAARHGETGRAVGRVRRWGSPSRSAGRHASAPFSRRSLRWPPPRRP